MWRFRFVAVKAHDRCAVIFRRRTPARCDLSEVPTRLLVAELSAREFVVLPDGLLQPAMRRLERREKEVHDWGILGRALIREGSRAVQEADALARIAAANGLVELEEFANND